MNTQEMTGMLYEVGTRIRALREIAGYSVVHMAEQTGLDVETYLKYESGTVAQEFQKGYKYHDTVIRYSMVGVVQ